MRRRINTAKSKATTTTITTTQRIPFSIFPLDLKAPVFPAAPLFSPSPPAEEPEAAAELSEEEAFLAKVDALQKMAESERKKAEEGHGMITPSPEDLMVFDATVENQNEIAAEDDPFFSKE